MTKRLTAKSIRYAMKQLEKGKRVSVVISEPEVTPRYILRLRAEFRETGSVYVSRFPGRLGVYDADPQPKDMKTMKCCLPHGLFINWTNHPRVYIAKS
ncbi:MAG: hypothetical protein F4010_03720 [Cenarchaeum sp. SB0669_bin_11]|nr:hypothetical protein [Cenarchaeum sp. SB0669_bin_11]